MKAMKAIPFCIGSRFLLGSSAMLVAFLVATVRVLGAEPPAVLEEAIRQAPAFFRPIVWIGPRAPSLGESADLWTALEVYRRTGVKGGFPALEQYLREHPDSPWTPWLRANLGEYYADHFQPTRALEHWAAVWSACRGLADAPGKGVADFALAHWARTLAAEAQVAELAALVADASGRRLDRGWLQEMFAAAQRRLLAMQTAPNSANACGAYALSQLAWAWGAASEQVAALLDLKAPAGGFSLGVLCALAGELGMPLLPVARPDGEGQIVVPSLIRWQLSHFAAIIDEANGYYLVMDPGYDGGRWLSAGTINAEASGYFLVRPDQVPGGWRRLSEAESRRIVGRLVDANGAASFDDDGDDDCPKDEEADTEETDASAPIAGEDPNLSEGCQECITGAAGDGEPCEEDSATCSSCRDSKGLAVWRVSEPDINVWLLDTPLFYTTTSGKRVTPRVTYRDRNARFATYDFNFNLGRGWEFSYLSFVQTDEEVPGQARFYAPHGAIRTYVPDGSTPEFRTSSRLGAITGGYRINYPSASQNDYTYAF